MSSSSRDLVFLVWFFLFFKQKTAYEMRISDWSSDVCSSDLAIGWTQGSASCSGGGRPVRRPCCLFAARAVSAGLPGPTRVACGRSSALCSPGVDDLNAGGIECGGVACGDGKALGGRDRCDVAVGCRKSLPSRASFDGKLGIMSSSTDVERQDAIREQLHYAVQSVGELFLALAVRKRTDPEHQLRDRDAGEIERFRRLFVEPNAYGIVGCGLHRLGHDVGVEEDHSKLIGLAGVLSRDRK